MKANSVTIVDHSTYDWSMTFNSKPWPESLTVPDQVMSLADIITRFTKNQAVPTIPVQNVDGDVTEFDSMDVFQKIDYQRKLQHRISVLKQKQLDEQAAEAAAKAKIEFDKAVRDAAAKFVPPSTNSDTNVS